MDLADEVQHMEFWSYVSMKKWILENMDAANGNMFIWVYDNDTAPEISKGYGPFPNPDDAETFVIHDLGYLLGEDNGWFAEVFKLIGEPMESCHWLRLSYFRNGETERVTDMWKSRF